jgi:hypothetical protein
METQASGERRLAVAASAERRKGFLWPKSRTHMI